MAKDPAVLFYTNDFLEGTYTMSDEHTGMYIKLLCLQHQRGILSEKDMLKICKTYVEDIFCKFVKTDAGYYNERMKKESEKRSAYSESRKNNRKAKKNDDTKNISSSYVPHMENGNINENRNRDINEDVLLKAPKKEKILLPWDSEQFKNQWGRWKDYKKNQHKFSYKSADTEQAALIELSKLSGGHENAASEIITQSIANGWKGFFSLKTNTNGHHQNGKRPTGGEISDADLFHAAADYLAANGHFAE